MNNKIPYAERLKQWRHAKNLEICKCPKQASELLQLALATKAQRIYDTEMQAEWYTNIITVDHTMHLVVSEIEAAELLTVKNTN